MTAALVPFAPGFEEMEGVIVVDIARRAGWRVDSVGLTDGPVEASRGVRILPDKAWADISPETYDLLVLPGGAGGVKALCADPRLLEAIRVFDRTGKWIGAICAAPLALQAAGILTPGRKVTCHPAVARQLPAGVRSDARTVMDGRLITSQGPGTAIDFALALIRQIDGEAAAARVAEGLVLSCRGG